MAAPATVTANLLVDKVLLLGTFPVTMCSGAAVATFNHLFFAEGTVKCCEFAQLQTLQLILPFRAFNACLDYIFDLFLKKKIH